MSDEPNIDIDESSKQDTSLFYSGLNVLLIVMLTLIVVLLVSFNIRNFSELMILFFVIVLPIACITTIILWLFTEVILQSNLEKMAMRVMRKSAMIAGVLLLISPGICFTMMFF